VVTVTKSAICIVGYFCKQLKDMLDNCASHTKPPRKENRANERLFVGQFVLGILLGAMIPTPAPAQNLATSLAQNAPDGHSSVLWHFNTGG